MIFTDTMVLMVDILGSLKGCRDSKGLNEEEKEEALTTEDKIQIFNNIR